MLIGLGIGLPFASAISLAAQIAALFAAGEQGAWYDPSDWATLFQDSAGTLPVTAVGQPVGLVLDKSKGLVLGAELVTNGGFATDTAWLKEAGWAIGSGVASKTAGVAGSLYQNAPAGLAQNTYCYITFTVTHSAGTCYFFLRGTDSTLVINAGGTYTVRTRAGADASYGINFYAAADFAGSIDNISVRELPGNHATQATSTKRPLLQQDATGRYYLAFDGVDDALATGSINFTATDKMTVVAGVRKLSDAATAILCELSADTNTNTGCFYMSAPASLAAANFTYLSKGTVASEGIGTTMAAPTTRVISGVSSISTDSAILRVNGAQASSSVTDQGTGNFGNYPLYIGAREGSSLFFNGNIYSLIIRGALSSDTQIMNTERYVNTKTGAF